VLKGDNVRHFGHAGFKEILIHKVRILQRQKALRKLDRAVEIAGFWGLNYRSKLWGLNYGLAKSVLATCERDTKAAIDLFEAMLKIVRPFQQRGLGQLT
jgi:hypothetical protein